jgi:sugar phosphate permease
MEPKGSLHWAWIILGTCFFNLVINYSIRLGYGVILPEMIHNLGFSRTAGGSIYNSHFLSYMAIAPLIGYLTDRLGARRVITLCCLILGFGVFLMGTIEILWTACLFYAIVGLGAAGMWTPVITVVQRWFSPQRRGLALGIISTGPGLGLATVGALFPWIVHHYDWRYAWYILGAGALVMFIVNGLFIRSDPESSGYAPWGQVEEAPPTEIPTQKIQSKAGTIPLVFTKGTFWRIGLSYFSITYSLYGITTFMVDYAKYQIGLPLERASLLATVHGICQVIGVLIVLPFSDYLGRKKTLIISNSFITGCLIGILFGGYSW